MEIRKQIRIHNTDYKCKIYYNVAQQHLTK